MDTKVAHELSADDPDYSIRDLYNAVAKGDYPSWSLKIQVMTFEQAETFRFNPFDLTKVINPALIRKPDSKLFNVRGRVGVFNALN